MARIVETETATLCVSEQTLSDLEARYMRECSPVNKRYQKECNPIGINPDWRGGIRSPEEVRGLLTAGWREGAARIADLGSFTDPPAPQSRRRRVVWGDTGEIDCDRALSGDWERAYRQSKRQIGAGPQVVELIVAWGGNCHRSADELFWTGAAALVTADLLENAGYSVRILATIFNTYQERKLVGKVIVKEASEPLQIDALASVLAHAGIFRTVGFQEVISAPWDVGCGLGCIMTRFEIDQLIASGEWTPPPGAIIMADAFDRDAARKAITSIITHIQQGGANAG